MLPCFGSVYFSSLNILNVIYILFYNLCSFSFIYFLIFWIFLVALRAVHLQGSTAILDDLALPCDLRYPSEERTRMTKDLDPPIKVHRSFTSKPFPLFSMYEAIIDFPDRVSKDIKIRKRTFFI